VFTAGSRSEQWRFAVEVKRVRLAAGRSRGTTRAVRSRRSTSRRAAASSRTSSQDPGSAESDPEPPIGPGWRWASDASWRNFVKSVHSRDFEHELHVERTGGWS
jgi:hypothetical protein